MEDHVGAPEQGSRSRYDPSGGLVHVIIVTTPPKIIPYYRLNHSIWALIDNKEASR
jgi:hypothetical protein